MGFWQACSMSCQKPRQFPSLKKVGNLDTLGTQLCLWGRRSAQKSVDMQAAAIVKALRQGHQGCSDRAAKVTATPRWNVPAADRCDHGYE
jgi:hypothetical protein